MTDQSLAIIKKTLNSTEIMTRFAALMGERESAYYINTVILAVANNKDLQECTPNSIVYSALRAASLKLSCDPALGEAHLVPFNNTKKNCTEATFIPGYKGLRNLATRTNKYRFINAGKLRNGEQWLEDPLTGKCTIGGKAIDNTKIGWFAFFEQFNGYSKGLFMTTEEIHDHAREYSKTYSNPRGKWQLDPESMEKKTVLRLLLVRWGDLGEAGNAFVEDEIINGDFHDELTVIQNDEPETEKRTQAQNLHDLGFDDNGHEPTPVTEPVHDLPEQDGELPIKQEENPNGHEYTEEEIYTAMVEAGAAPDLYSAKGALGKCTTGWDTPIKAEAWLKVYRQWRNQKLTSDAAAVKANAGEVPA